MFEPPNKDLPVKAVLISGPSCAGKTHLLKCISDENKFSQITIFEMDSLEYYHPKKLEAQLGHAKIRFDSWFLAQKKASL